MISLLCGFIQTIIVTNILRKIFFKKVFAFKFTVLIVYYCIFTIPLMLDALIGIAQYSEISQYIYELASENNKVIIAFNIINVLLFLLLYFLKKEFVINLKFTKITLINPVLIIISILPIALVITNINDIPSFKYGSLLHNADFSQLYVLFSNVTLISVALGMLYLILNPKRHIYISFVMYLSIFFSIYMNGKRLVVLIFLLLFVVKTYINSKNKFKTIGVSILCIVFIFIFNLLYSNFLDNEYQLNKFNEDKYLQFRIDYTRDHNVKMVLYKELYPNEQKVLDYRGQSFIYNLLFFIPREKWPEKPYPYGVYVTAASLGLLSTDDIKYQMTTSILDESIANLGLPFGILFFILIINLFTKIGFQYKDDTLLFTATNFVLFLLLTMQFSFSCVFILFWCLLVFFKKRFTFQKERSNRMASSIY